MPKAVSTRVTLIGIVGAIAVAALCATILHMWLTGPTYDITPDAVLLTSADVAPSLMLDGTGSVGPAQRTVAPLPYQQQMIGGRIRIFIAKSVESPAGLQEINGWSAKYGGPISNPPTVMGPFVADHSGIFELDDVARTFQTPDAARQEYHCCHYPDRGESFTDYHTLAVHIGDEADAWTGVNRPLSGPGISPDMPQSDAYQERGFVVHWRHGPVVSNLSIWGAHDITLDQALSFAQIVDARIAHAMQGHQKQAKENDNASTKAYGATSSSYRLPFNTSATYTLWASDHSLDSSFLWNRASAACQRSHRCIS